MTVTLVAIAVAAEGIVHWPFVPETANVAVSSAPIGAARDPTVETTRVSTNRHGAVGTNDDADVGLASTL
jgi:hypothetical protein